MTGQVVKLCPEYPLEKKVVNYENLEQEMAALKKALEEKQDQGKQNGFLSKIHKNFH